MFLCTMISRHIGMRSTSCFNHFNPGERDLAKGNISPPAGSWMIVIQLVDIHCIKLTVLAVHEIKYSICMKILQFGLWSNLPTSSTGFSSSYLLLSNNGSICLLNTHCLVCNHSHAEWTETDCKPSFCIYRVAGATVIMIEAPCCCLFVDFVQNISDWVEKRPYWNRAAFYCL